MGLHLCYEISLLGDCDESTAAERVHALHEHALTLPLEEVSSIVHCDQSAIAAPPVFRGLGFDRLEDCALFSAHCRRDVLYRNALGFSEDDEYDVVDERTRIYRPISAPADLPSAMIGFTVWPGMRCEPATFALTRLAGPVITTRWWDHCCCKTQYASVVGDEHLLRCHTSLVALLDFARSIGFDVEVRDETGYWKSRDPRVLFENVAEMNRIVARMAGAFGNAMRKATGDSSNVGGSIFKHPDFERLESDRE